VSLILGVVFAGSTADERARREFGIPEDQPVNAETVAMAARRLIIPGTAEPDVVRGLQLAGIGRDGLSRYYPPSPDSKGRGVLIIGSDKRFQIVGAEYIVVFEFDSNRLLRSVTAEKRFVGP
jgi:hypothetical protein